MIGSGPLYKGLIQSTILCADAVLACEGESRKAACFQCAVVACLAVHLASMLSALLTGLLRQWRHQSLELNFICSYCFNKDLFDSRKHPKRVLA